MGFNLRRIRDNQEESGPLSVAISWNDDGSYKDRCGFSPQINCSMMVGSATARTYSNQDYWLTTPVTEILVEIKDEENHYIKFKTENSEYEWWYGKHPKEGAENSI